MGFIQPAKNCEEKIKNNLTLAFQEEHLKDMYGAKEEAQDEDFFPYIMSTLTCPIH